METEFFLQGALAVVRLNRPNVLNALGPSQFPEIHRQLALWAKDDRVGAVMVMGAGERAFCAGGDIRTVWENRQRGDLGSNRTLFRAEYSLDRLIHRYPKPYVSLLNGIVMGGGAGISVNGAFQVATERTVFAMPEAAIGFFPDVGGTHFLNRCPGRLGLYLGMTGVRLSGAEMRWAGLASHYCSAIKLTGLMDGLAAAAVSADPRAAVRETLDSFDEAPPRGELVTYADQIDSCFAKDTPAEIMGALKACDAPWAKDALSRLSAASPTSLAVIFRQITGGAGLDFEQVMAREYRLASAFLDNHDFYEGIRAAIVDKDRTPRWQPGTLPEVDDATVEHYFGPIADELVFAGYKGR